MNLKDFKPTSAIIVAYLIYAGTAFLFSYVTDNEKNMNYFAFSMILMVLGIILLELKKLNDR